MRTLTKSDRLESQRIQFENLVKNGYTQEVYKGLNIFTKKEGVSHLVKVFKDTAANHIDFVAYRTADDQQKAVERFKTNYDRHAEYKAKLKANPTTSTAANCAKAIREELKGFYPQIKFSVTSSNFSMGNSVDVSWIDGPTANEIDSIIGKYQYGSFNGMEDIYENTNRREDLPQAKYVSSQRKMSEETAAILEPQEQEITKDWEGYNRNFLYQIFRKTSIPFGATVTGIGRTDKTCGVTEDMYKIDFTTPEVIEATKPEAVEVEAGKVQVIEYSEKAIAVIGDTYPVRAQLKELGGRFNKFLSCGAGWIFPKTKLSEIQNALLA